LLLIVTNLFKLYLCGIRWQASAYDSRFELLT